MVCTSPFLLWFGCMKKILLAIIGMAIIILIPSCTTIRHTSFERLYGADVNFPEQVRTVGVVNCLPVVTERVWNDLPNICEGEGKLMAESLAQEIAETHYFDQVIICDSVVIPSGKEATLSGNQIDSLIQSLGVDILLAVERVQLDMSTGVTWFPELMQKVPVLRVGVTPLIGAYKEMRDRPLFKVCKTDTIYWELPLDVSMDQVVENSSEFAATIPMKHLLPYWGEVYRFYFDGGIAEIRDAGIYLREQNWDAAAELWKTVYDKKKGKQKMYAAFNLALYHEMKDEFSRAKEYLETAFELSKAGTTERLLIQYYYIQLEELLEKNKNLQVQMKRFEMFF